MNEERRKILDMLAEGKITVEEAEKLLSAISESPSEPEQKKKPDSTKKPKYLRVLVEPGPNQKNGERVNIRIPMKLLRAGIKLASLLPSDVQDKVDGHLKEKGIAWNLSQITEDNLEEIVDGLNDLTVDVEGKEKVRIFCE